MLEMYGRNSNDSGMYGDIFELNLKAFLSLKKVIAKQGRTDITKARITYEVKTNGGELNAHIGTKLIKGSRMVIYAPYVDIYKNIEEQNAFLISREQFIEALTICGLIREKTATDGTRKNTIQTVWVYKHNKPHSAKKYNALCEMLASYEEENGINYADWLNSYK